MFVYFLFVGFLHSLVPHKNSWLLKKSSLCFVLPWDTNNQPEYSWICPGLVFGYLGLGSCSVKIGNFFAVDDISVTRILKLLNLFWLSVNLTAVMNGLSVCHIFSCVQSRPPVLSDPHAYKRSHAQINSHNIRSTSAR